LGAYSHQDVPFDKLVELLQPERNLSHTPIFQVLFVMENFARGKVSLNGVQLEALGSEFPVSKFDLSLFLREGSDGLQGLWAYRTDLFDASSIDRISGQFSTLLTQLLQEPDRHIEDLKASQAPVGDEGASDPQRAERIRGARRKVSIPASTGGPQ
jgi:non-ribosomal peptide synthetase component F